MLQSLTEIRKHEIQCFEWVQFILNFIGWG